MTTATLTTSDVAAKFDVHNKTITRHAARLGLGINFGGRAGYRFSDADVTQLAEALKTQPAPVVVRRRQRR